MAESALQKMIARQIRARGVRDQRVLKALAEIPREHFVPLEYRDKAFDDAPLPIGFNQTISQPYIVAYMTELLQVEPADRVLEIGTGSGYQTAILAKLAREIYSVDIIPELFELATRRLDALAIKNAFLKCGDGNQGWLEHAPFDKIIATAAASRLPEAWREQLREGGRLAAPLGTEDQKIILGRMENGFFRTVETIPVRFVPLVQTA